MSRPPGEISGGQQVQSHGSPAAGSYLKTSNRWSNKAKLHSDISHLDLYLISKSNSTKRNVLHMAVNKWNLLT